MIIRVLDKAVDRSRQQWRFDASIYCFVKSHDDDTSHIRWVELHEQRFHDAIQSHVYFDSGWRHVCVEECTPNIDRNDLATFCDGRGCCSSTSFVSPEGRNSIAHASSTVEERSNATLLTLTSAFSTKPSSKAVAEVEIGPEYSVGSDS